MLGLFKRETASFSHNESSPSIFMLEVAFPICPFKDVVLKGP